MPSILARSPPPPVAPTKNNASSKFRTVLGLSHLQRTSLDHDNSATLPLPTPPTSRRKALNQSLFQQPAAAATQPRHSEDLSKPVMPAATRPHRVPIAASQDGPWSVSVAENPNDPRTYSIYIKSSSLVAARGSEC